jgi:hypothetical protein
VRVRSHPVSRGVDWNSANGGLLIVAFYGLLPRSVWSPAVLAPSHDCIRNGDLMRSVMEDVLRNWTVVPGTSVLDPGRSM